MKKLRFHLLGVAYLETVKSNSICPFTQKVLKLAQILKNYGHTVYFYGVESSKVICDEFIQVSTQEVLKQTYGDFDRKKMLFGQTPDDSAHQEFNKNAITGILKRKEDGDILLCSMGLNQKVIADAVGLITVELGIGYPGTFAPYKIFESYAWMHYVYGQQGIGDGLWYDAVIPNYYDVNDFPFQKEKKDYLLYMGRIVNRKGVQLASEVAKETGYPLYVVGQGDLNNDSENLHLGEEEHIHYRSAVGPKERAELLKYAKAVLMPTYYIEPFGSVCMEAQMCGTPVITTDWGAFPETVVHGITGFRCRTYEEFCWAVKNINLLQPENCRKWAQDNYSINRVGKMYEEYFQRLHRLYEKGWYQDNPDRVDLEWLERYYPN